MAENKAIAERRCKCVIEKHINIKDAYIELKERLSILEKRLKDPMHNLIDKAVAMDNSEISVIINTLNFKHQNQ